MTKLEQKALDYAVKNCFKGSTEVDLLSKGYKDGYEQGHEDKNKELVIMLNNQMQTTRDLKKENAELKAQIEKMKRCTNCSRAYYSDGVVIDCGYDTRFEKDKTECKNFSHWELEK